MPLAPCRECRRQISTEAAACPHCGCPATPDAPSVSGLPIVVDKPPSGPRCYACNSPPDKACGQCGRLGCSRHVGWSMWSRRSGPICSDCAQMQMIIGGIGLVVIAVIYAVWHFSQ